MPVKADLVVVGGKASKSHIALKLPTLIGRGAKAGLTIAHPMVSRRHCEVFEIDGLLMIRDLDSLNGTQVGWRRIREAPLPPDAEFTVGPLTFRVRYQYGGDLSKLPAPVLFEPEPPASETAETVATQPEALDSEAGDQPAAFDMSAIEEVIGPTEADAAFFDEIIGASTTAPLLNIAFEGDCEDQLGPFLSEPREGPEETEALKEDVAEEAEPESTPLPVSRSPIAEESAAGEEPGPEFEIFEELAIGEEPDVEFESFAAPSAAEEPDSEFDAVEELAVAAEPKTVVGPIGEVEAPESLDTGFQAAEEQVATTADDQTVAGAMESNEALADSAVVAISRLGVSKRKQLKRSWFDPLFEKLGKTPHKARTKLDPDIVVSAAETEPEASPPSEEALATEESPVEEKPADEPAPLGQPEPAEESPPKTPPSFDDLFEDLTRR